MNNLLKWSAPLVVAMLFALPVSVSAKGEWKSVQTSEKDFSVSMPANAEMVEKKVQNVTIKAFTANEDGTNYSITHGAGVGSAPTSDAADAIGNGAIGEFKKQAEKAQVALTIDKKEDVQGVGWSGKKSYISVGPAKLEMLAALSENKNVGYCLITVSEQNATPDQNFFNSFKVDTKITNELYANKAQNLGQMIGIILGIAVGGGVGFFVVNSLNKKKKSAS
jgi:hypothetical protein